MLNNPLFFSVVVAALVSAIITFLLNIFLERFKFKHQYRQFYANRKLLGCEELCSAISKVLADYFAIRGIIGDTKDPKELTESQLDFITDFIKDMKNQLEAILKNLGYLSPELREEMVNYIYPQLTQNHFHYRRYTKNTLVLYSTLLRSSIS